MKMLQFPRETVIHLNARKSWQILHFQREIVTYRPKCQNRSGQERRDVEHGGLRAPATDRWTKTGQKDRQTDRQTPTQDTPPPKRGKTTDDRGLIAHGVVLPVGVVLAPVASWYLVSRSCPDKEVSKPPKQRLLPLGLIRPRGGCDHPEVCPPEGGSAPCLVVCCAAAKKKQTPNKGKKEKEKGNKKLPQQQTISREETERASEESWVPSELSEKGPPKRDPLEWLTNQNSNERGTTTQNNCPIFGRRKKGRILSRLWLSCFFQSRHRAAILIHFCRSPDPFCKWDVGQRGRAMKSSTQHLLRSKRASKKVPSLLEIKGKGPL